MKIKKSNKGVGIVFDDEGKIELHVSKLQIDPKTYYNYLQIGGMASDEEIWDEPDPKGKRLSIPNEKRLKWDKVRTLSSPPRTRKIPFKGNGI